jgi:hypothetical protein
MMEDEPGIRWHLSVSPTLVLARSSNAAAQLPYGSVGTRGTAQLPYGSGETQGEGMPLHFTHAK